MHISLHRKLNLLVLILCGVLLCSCSAVTEETEVVYDGAPNHTLPLDSVESEIETETTDAITPPNKKEDSDDVLFVINRTEEGPFDWGNNYLQETTYTILYNGSIEIQELYSESGYRITNKVLTDDDFSKISSKLESVYTNQPLTKIDYSDYCDGCTWGFTYYDPNGNETYICGGYTDGCTDLETVQNILKSYEDELNDYDIVFEMFEGYYVCPDDEQLYLNIFRDDEGGMCVELVSPDSEDSVLYELNNAYLQASDEGNLVVFIYEEQYGASSAIPFLYFSDNNTMTLQEIDGDTIYIRE